MKKVELLSPAGNFEMLKSAIHNGADAIYLAGNKYGARKFATNFSNEEIVEAIKYAHLYGVKIYITVNTLIKDEEVSEFLDFIEYIHKNNVDAIIIQDLGMINLIRKTFPNLEIHASTQFHNHNIEDLKYLKEIGVKRAVLARELSLNEIKDLDIDIEKEIFIHGALCICYSGQCLMSSIIMNRSGNRGECAGMCRLPYTLLENGKIINTPGKYLISPKELCTIENIKEIIESGVDSLKIEGRMKSPEYVGYITKIYRKVIDAYYNNESISITEEEINNLKVLYNREFTNGFLFNEKKIINQKTPNHQGIEIGQVLDYNSKKITIKLKKDLNQGDGIRFKNEDKGLFVNFLYNKKGLLINQGKSNQIIQVDNKIGLNSKDIVLKTVDGVLIKNIKNYKLKQIPISINVLAKLNQKLTIEFNDGINSVIMYGNEPLPSLTSPITKSNIIEKLTKLGNSIYSVKNINIELDDNIFIPIKTLNELKRNLIEELNNKRISPKVKFIKQEPFFKTYNINLTNKLNILIDKDEDYINIKNINYYTENKELYLKYKDNYNIYYRLPRVINNDLNIKNEKLLVNDIGYINKLNNNNEIHSDIYMNVTNIYTLEYLISRGISTIGISPELTKENVYKLYENFYNHFKYYPNINILAYGKIELMIMKHCILKDNISNNQTCNICRNNKKYELIDRNSKKYTIKQNNCINTLLNYDIYDISNELLRKKGINYYISLIDIIEKQNIKKIIKEWENDKNSYS